MGEVADYGHGEPAPVVSTGPSMHDLVSDDAVIVFSEWQDDSEEKCVLVVELMRKRKEFGMRKYGTPLRAHNGRRPMFDLLDELGDALVYYRQAIEEDDPGLGDLVQEDYEVLLDITARVCLATQSRKA